MYISYRTKKYTVRFLTYITGATLLALLTIWLAHNNQLPAVFEKYTGAPIRATTQDFYLAVFGSEPTEQKVVQSGSFGSTMAAVRDIFLREPGYLAASEAMGRIREQLKVLPVNKNRREFLHEIKADPAIIQWMRSPKGRFSQIFLFEIKRRLDINPYIKTFFLFDKDGKILFNYDKNNKDARFLIKPDIQPGLTEKGFSTEILDGDAVIGLASGEWDPWFFPDIPLGTAAASGMNLLILDESDIIRNGKPAGLPGDLFRSTEGNQRKFVGPHNGSFGKYRFISGHIYPYALVVAYPAASPGFYVFRTIVYLLVLFSVVITYVFARKAYAWFQETRYTPKHIWLNDELKNSMGLNSTALNLARESQNLASQLKEREIERLDLIARRISDLARRKPADAQVLAERKEIQENVISRKAYISETAEIPEILTEDVIADTESLQPQSPEPVDQRVTEKASVNQAPEVISLTKQTIDLPSIPALSHSANADSMMVEKDVTPEPVLAGRVFPPAIVLDKSERESIQIIDELETSDKAMLLADEDAPDQSNAVDEITSMRPRQTTYVVQPVQDDLSIEQNTKQEKSVAKPEAIQIKKPSLAERARELLMLEKGYIADEELENFELDFAEEVFTVDGPVTEVVDQTLIRNFKYKPIHDTATVLPGQTQREELFLVEDLDEKYLVVA